MAIHGENVKLIEKKIECHKASPDKIESKLKEYLDNSNTEYNKKEETSVPKYIADGVKYGCRRGIVVDFINDEFE
jgi:hypothetical protein